MNDLVLGEWRSRLTSMRTCLLSWPGRRTMGDWVGGEEETADEVRAIAVRSISIIEVNYSYGKWANLRNYVPSALKAFFLKLRAFSTSSSVGILMFSGWAWDETAAQINEDSQRWWRARAYIRWNCCQSRRLKEVFQFLSLQNFRRQWLPPRDEARRLGYPSCDSRHPTCVSTSQVRCATLNGPWWQHEGMQHAQYESC